jgi:hypothetical protein
MRKVDLLTQAQVKNAKPDAGKFVKRLLDGGGLYLQATRSTNGGVSARGGRRSTPKRRLGPSRKSG